MSASRSPLLPGLLPHTVPGLPLEVTHSSPPTAHTPEGHTHTEQTRDVCAPAPTRHFRVLDCNAAPPVFPVALFLDRLMKRRQESGYLIEEIGDVLLARVRVPCVALSPPPREIWVPGLSHLRLLSISVQDWC